MPLLDAALAFALTMLALASVATLLVEIFHRVTQVRTRGLKKMLSRLYEKELQPWVKEQLQKAGAGVEAGKAKFLQQMLQNPMIDSTKLAPALRSLERMSTEDFLRRLGDTQPGQLLLKVGKDRAADLEKQLDRLALKFEELGKCAGDFFARRAKILSIAVGIVLAFLGNVNGKEIFDTYLENPRAAQAVIDRGEEIQQNWQQAEQRLDQTLKDLQAKGAGAETEGEIRRLVGEVNAGLSSLQADAEGIESSGLPIGYRDGAPVPPFGLWDWSWWQWFLIVLLTGVLLGLGGPFWFDVVMRLTAVRQAVRGGGGQAAPAAPAGGPAPPASPPDKKALLAGEA